MILWQIEELADAQVSASSSSPTCRKQFEMFLRCHLLFLKPKKKTKEENQRKDRFHNWRSNFVSCASGRCSISVVRTFRTLQAPWARITVCAWQAARRTSEEDFLPLHYLQSNTLSISHSILHSIGYIIRAFRVIISRGHRILLLHFRLACIESNGSKNQKPTSHKKQNMRPPGKTLLLFFELHWLEFQR